MASNYSVSLMSCRILRISSVSPALYLNSSLRSSLIVFSLQTVYLTRLLYMLTKFPYFINIENSQRVVGLSLGLSFLLLLIFV